jgi:hypothetical protein
VREDSFERVLVNYCGHGFFSAFAQAAYNSPGAIHKDIRISAQDGGRQDDAELDDGANGDFRGHVEQDPACGNVSGFSEMLVGVAGSDGNGKLEREANRVSEISHHCTSTHTHVLYTAFEAAQSYFGIFENTIGHAHKVN